MRAAAKSGIAEATVIEVPTPGPGQGEVLIAVKACAVCASDFEGWLAAPGDDQLPAPWNPNNPGLTGHEISGEVAALGPGVASGRLGQRVWLDAITGCGTCVICQSGRQVLCPRVRVNSQGFADYILAPARQCHPLPADIELRHRLTALRHGWHAIRGRL